MLYYFVFNRKGDTMDTYYEDILNKVEQLIAENDIQNAFCILEEELSMPYIPKAYEDRLISLYNDCRSQINESRKARSYGEEEIGELLHGSLEEQFLAVEQLKKSNIRNHLDEIRSYLKGNTHYFVRSCLIEAMMEQNISEEFTTEMDGLEVTFTPCFVEMLQESDGVEKAVSYLQEWFESDNPTFTMMCVESLIKEAYLRLPFTIEEDEAFDLAVDIACYVFKANEDKEGLMAFLNEKGLAQSYGYELLLSKHDV